MGKETGKESGPMDIIRLQDYIQGSKEPSMSPMKVFIHTELVLLLSVEGECERVRLVLSGSAKVLQ